MKELVWFVIIIVIGAILLTMEVRTVWIAYILDLEG